MAIKKKPAKKQEKQEQTKKDKAAPAASLNTNYSTPKFKYATGIPHFDINLGGGYQSGRVYEVFGPESIGKTTLAEFSAMTFLNKCKDGRVLWVESEFSLDKLRFMYMGGDLSRVDVMETMIVEEAFDEMEKRLSDGGPPKFIVWDTIAVCGTKNDYEKGANSGGLNERARLVRVYLKRINPMLAKCDSTLIFLNQVYDRIGIPGYGTPGGRGIRIHSSVRMQVSSIKSVVRRTPGGIDVEEGNVVNVYTKKNKLFYPRLNCVLYIHNERGVLIWDSIFEHMKESKIVGPAAGGWYVLPPWLGHNELKFQSAEHVEAASNKYPELKEYLSLQTHYKYASISPLVKVRLIGEINKLEESLGLQTTEVTDKEYELCKMAAKLGGIEEDD